MRAHYSACVLFYFSSTAGHPDVDDHEKQTKPQSRYKKQESVAGTIKPFEPIRDIFAESFHHGLLQGVDASQRRNCCRGLLRISAPLVGALPSMNLPGQRRRSLCSADGW